MWGSAHSRFLHCQPASIPIGEQSLGRSQSTREAVKAASAMRGDDFSPTMKATAIYLHNKKYYPKEKVCRLIGCDEQTLEGWLEDEDAITEEVKAELTKHLVSRYAS